MAEKGFQKYIFWAVIALAIGTPILLRNKESSLGDYLAPKYVSYDSSSKSVTFRDDRPENMKAYVTYGRNTKELISAGKQENYRTFSIPKEALDSGKFSVEALDKDGNRSKPQTLEEIEGIEGSFFER